ncbi:hypothetical protein P7C73_g6125, partial [Tremellales sp. Uapishka_1]
MVHPGTTCALSIPEKFNLATLHPISSRMSILIPRGPRLLPRGGQRIPLARPAHRELSTAPLFLLHPITSLSELFLSLPYPYITSYGLTIILSTLLFRSAITLPATLWQRARMKRLRENVMPEMKKLNDRLAVVVARESRSQGRSFEEYKAELKAQVGLHSCSWGRRRREDKRIDGISLHAARDAPIPPAQKILDASDADVARPPRGACSAAHHPLSEHTGRRGGPRVVDGARTFRLAGPRRNGHDGRTADSRRRDQHGERRARREEEEETRGGGRGGCIIGGAKSGIITITSTNTLNLIIHPPLDTN